MDHLYTVRGQDDLVQSRLNARLNLLRRELAKAAKEYEKSQIQASKQEQAHLQRLEAERQVFDQWLAGEQDRQVKLSKRLLEWNAAPLVAKEKQEKIQRDKERNVAEMKAEKEFLARERRLEELESLERGEKIRVFLKEQKRVLKERNEAVKEEKSRELDQQKAEKQREKELEMVDRRVKIEELLELETEFLYLWNFVEEKRRANEAEEAKRRKEREMEYRHEWKHEKLSKLSEWHEKQGLIRGYVKWNRDSGIQQWQINAEKRRKKEREELDKEKIRLANNGGLCTIQSNTSRNSRPNTGLERSHSASLSSASSSLSSSQSHSKEEWRKVREKQILEAEKRLEQRRINGTLPSTPFAKEIGVFMEDKKTANSGAAVNQDMLGGGPDTPGGRARRVLKIYSSSSLTPRGQQHSEGNSMASTAPLHSTFYFTPQQHELSRPSSAQSNASESGRGLIRTRPSNPNSTQNSQKRIVTIKPSSTAASNQASRSNSVSITDTTALDQTQLDTTMPLDLSTVSAIPLMQSP